jgi:alpha-glucosidase
VFSRFAQVVGNGWPCWAISNHDIPRVASRWGGTQPPSGLLRAAAALQLSLRGSACIYQGDELGLPEADIAFEDLQDPYGIAMWPEFKGRDGCRTPMPWEAGDAQLGFSSARPWLPAAELHRVLAVDRQEADRGSLLQLYRTLLAWRRTQPALIHGEMELLPVHEQVLAHVRSHAGRRLLCAFNLSDRAATLALPAGLGAAARLDGSGAAGGEVAGGALHFQPWGVLFARLG